MTVATTKFEPSEPSPLDEPDESGPWPLPRLVVSVLILM